MQNMCYEKVMQKRRRRRVPRQKAARDDAGTEKEEFVVEIKVRFVRRHDTTNQKTMTKTKKQR